MKQSIARYTEAKYDTLLELRYNTTSMLFEVFLGDIVDGVKIDTRNYKSESIARETINRELIKLIGA